MKTKQRDVFQMRVPDWLAKLVRDCAEHCGLDVSDIVRRTMRWMVKNKAPSVVYHIDHNAVCGTSIIKARNVSTPKWFSTKAFRNALAFRCQEAMSRPSCKEVSINFLCMYGDGLTPQAVDKTEE